MNHVINIIALFVAAFIFFRLIFPLPVKGRTKAWLTLALVMAASKFVITLINPHYLASPELPRGLLLINSWLFGALMLLFLMTVAKDALCLLVWLTRVVLKKPRSDPRRRIPIAAALALTALAASAWAVWEAVKTPEVIRTEITLAGLPPELDGLTIVQLSDQHISRLLPRPRTERTVEITNALNPDLILVTGDVADGYLSLRADDVAPMTALRAKYGVYGCVGNHEYYSGFDQWLAALSGLGLTMLYNSHQTLNINGADLVLAGVADPVGASPRFNLPGPDPRAALAGKPEGAPVILLAHQPKNAAAYAALGPDLILSGHTHGGIIRGFDRVVAAFNHGYVAGLYQVGATQLYVNRGTGLWNGFPLRLGVPGEISLLTLRTERGV